MDKTFIAGSALNISQRVNPTPGLIPNQCIIHAGWCQGLKARYHGARGVTTKRKKEMSDSSESNTKILNIAVHGKYLFIYIHRIQKKGHDVNDS